MATAEKQKLISIIAATYNCGRKIEDTLQSIFSQNADLFEVIVVDGASVDDTLPLIEKYRDRITLVSEKDDGVYYAFNKAIDLATGKYLYFIGAGDLLKPGILDEIKEFLPAETPSLVYGKVFFAKQKLLNGKEFDAKLFARDNLCQQGIFYHREIFRMVGKFDTEYKILADWLFNLKCFLDPRITKRYLETVIADYEEDGLSADINRDSRFIKEFPLFVKNQLGVYQYIICKAFLKNPYLFNYIYYRKFYLLMSYFASNYKFCGTLAAFIKPFVRACRNLKKIYSEIK